MEFNRLALSHIKEEFLILDQMTCSNRRIHLYGATGECRLTTTRSNNKTEFVCCYPPVLMMTV